MDNLRVEVRDGIHILWLDRPERRNAMHGPMWTGLGEIAARIATESPRALIVTGVQGHFCAGMDLKPDNPLVMRLVPAVHGGDADEVRAIIIELKTAVGRLTEMPCPVIAAVEGACAGGGLEVALAADMRVASKSAFFSLPETHVGMVPDVGGTVRLSRLVGQGRATELILTGARIDADRAYEMGLVNRVVDEGGALEAALELARATRRAAPEAAKHVLAVLREGPVATFEEETQAGLRTLLSKELIEGTMAFVEKRDPSWMA